MTMSAQAYPCIPVFFAILFVGSLWEQGRHARCMLCHCFGSLGRPALVYLRTFCKIRSLLHDDPSNVLRQHQ